MMKKNNAVASALSRYICDMPCAITARMLRETDPDGEIPEQVLFAALLFNLCGLGDEGLLYDYLLPGTHLLDAEEYMADPYIRNIRFPDARRNGWALGYQSYAPYEAFVCNDIVLLPDGREVPQIGFFRTEFRYPTVFQDGREWMAVKPSEIESMKAAIGAVEGRVATFGLGLGYFAYMASLKPSVESVTVVERDADVIALFDEHIRPQFAESHKIRVVQSDAFAYMRDMMPDEGFDYAFVDIWHDISDGLPLYLEARSLESLSPGTRFLYWVEESLKSARRWQEALAEGEGL